MRKLFSWVSVVAFVAVAGAVVVPAATFAQTTTASTSIQSQLDLIASLTAQIQALQQQIQALQTQQQSATVSLVSSLSLGSQGDQVSVLQALLAANPNIYPEGLITGYFGQLTEQAVKRFQKDNGLEQVGVVGPQTREKLNLDMENNPVSFENTSTTSMVATSINGGGNEGENGDQGQNQNQNGNGNQNEGGNHGQLCAIVPPGHLIAPGWLRHHGGEGETPIIPECQTLPSGIENQLPTSTPTTTPSTTVALVISGVGSSVVTTSTATVAWTTNLQANSQVMYGLTSAYGSSMALDSSLVTSHEETITGLAAGTVYHFQAESANASGTATSSDMTFTTNALPVLPPVISAITSSVASTTVSISWTTNEAATSQVYYGTINPLNITSTSTASVSSTTLVTNHVLTLSGLNATTTYYFIVQSADASANTATSSQMSFTTMQ